MKKFVDSNERMYEEKEKKLLKRLCEEFDESQNEQNEIIEYMKWEVDWWNWEYEKMK